MLDLVIVLAIMATALPVSFGLSPNRNAVFLALPVATVIATLSAFAHVLLDAQISLLYLGLSICLSLIFLLRRNIREQIVVASREILRDMESKTLLIAFFIFSLITTVTTPPPLAWDARSIWFHHASWLNGPALYFREAQFLPAGYWPDYPFAGPAIMTLSWQLSFSDENFYLASRIIGILVLSLSFYILSLVLKHRETKLHIAIVIGLILTFIPSALMIGQGLYNAGYQDPLQAVAVGALLFSILLLSGSSEQNSILIMFTLTFLATNIKQEGFWFSAIAVILAVVWKVFQREYIYLALIPFLLAIRIAWSSFSNLVGMPENSHTAEVLGRLPNVFIKPGDFIASFSLIWEQSLFPRSVGFVFLGLLSLLALFVTNKTERASRLAIGLVVFLTAVGTLATSIITYVLGDSQDLSWWLNTSYVRITATFEFLTLAAALLAAALIAPWTHSEKQPVKKQKVKK